MEEKKITEQQVYDYYQERSVQAGERADQLAWMFILMATGVLIAGNAWQTFMICAALAALYMMLSVLQSVWQTFTAWIFMKQVARMEEPPNDYPSWVGCGAWLFFWLKMLAISTAVIFFIQKIFS